MANALQMNYRGVSQSYWVPGLFIEDPIANRVVFRLNGYASKAAFEAKEQPLAVKAYQVRDDAATALIAAIQSQGYPAAAVAFAKAAKDQGPANARVSFFETATEV